jgi:hypothetical protein
VLAEAFGAHGFEVAVSEHALAFSDTSAADWLDTEERRHPMWVTGRETMQARGTHTEARERSLAILTEANEDPAAFRITSPYVIAVARRV